MSVLITPSTFSFLEQLSQNNNREWFEVHKKHFKEHETNFKHFCETLKNKMNVHDELEGAKVFRIYRDVRFSANKVPYKTHFAGVFMRVKPKLRGSYYLHITPGGSFIATGFWDPEKNDLLRIRKELEIDADEFRNIVQEQAFQKVWGKLEGEEVKTAPKGFDKNHKNIDLIRKKQYIFTREFTDSQVTSGTFLEEVNSSFKAVRPFFDYMTDVLTTNLNGESLL
ncbi:DUF2461 domain-containing protein [Ascidiimonas aurantiaca]|uniref:DUF2461 domain-containing protein n=1 Tax=Ascidiimonas aurantiaca TaxID=1685432 RepID=UPI0030EB63D9